MKLNFKEFGSGDPVIILHGLFGMLDNWKTFAKALSSDFTVFTLDLRNHGRSPWSDDFSYKIMADDVLEFMEDHWIYSCHLVGHSMGAKVAMEVANQESDYLETLTCVDMGIKQYRGGHESILAALMELDLSHLEDRNAIQTALIEKIPDKAVVQFLAKNINRRKEGGFQFKMNLPVINDKYKHLMKGVQPEYPIEIPSFFPYGQQSNYILEDDKLGILKHFPNAVFKEIEGAGHWIHAEKPALLEQELRNFWNQNT